MHGFQTSVDQNKIIKTSIPMTLSIHVHSTIWIYQIRDQTAFIILIMALTGIVLLVTPKKQPAWLTFVIP